MAKRKPVPKQLSQADVALFAAIREGDADRVREALKNGADANAADQNGPALVQATEHLCYGDEMGAALIGAGADLGAMRHAIGWAVYFRNLDLVRKLIAAGADVNAAGAWGAPLAVAARYGHAEIAVALVAAGADLNASAPLVHAIKNRHSDIACALIERGAYVNIGPAASQVSPIAQAVASNDLRVLRALIEAGADLTQSSKAHFTVDVPHKRSIAADDPPAELKAQAARLEEMRNTTVVSGPPLTLAARCGHAEAARLLLEAGADPHYKDVDGLTPFECAMRYAHTAVADALRGAGGDQRRDTPEEQLLAAAGSGDTDEVRRLLAAGAMAEARDARKTTSRRTPLMLAAGEGHDDALSALLAAGANLNATDEPSGKPGPGFKPCFNMGGLEHVETEFRLGRTALMFAAAGGHIDVIRTLVSAGAGVDAEDFAACTALYLAARGGHAEAVSELLKSGAKLNARGPKGGTALAAATMSGSLETVEALLAHGAKVNVKSRDDGSPLEIACDKKSADLARLLLRRGDFKPDADAFANAFTRLFTWNFMSPPTEEQILATLEELAAAGAHANCVDKHGNTPLGMAVGSKRPKLLRVVSRLIELGANVDAGRGKDTALQGTVVHRNIDAAKILLEHGADVLAKNEEGETVLQFARKFYKKPDEEDKQFLDLLESYAGHGAQSQQSPARTPRPKQAPPKTAGKKRREASWKEREAPSPNFSMAARSENYLAVLDELERLSGTKRQPLDGVDGAFSFHVVAGLEVDIVKLQRRLLTQSTYLVAWDFSGPADPPQRLLCFPTTEKYEAVAAIQTGGANDGLSTGGIIHWLRETEKEQPLIFTNIGRDVIAGQFVTEIKDAEKLARRMIDFCPGIEDAHDDLADFVNDLRKNRRFDFWWD